MTRATIGSLMILAVLAGLIACGTGAGGKERGDLEAVARDLHARGEELRRTFADRADRIRAELEAARGGIEAILERHPAASEETVRLARARAAQALERAAELLGSVEEDRDGGAARRWARVLQDGMTRLERSLDRLATRTGREHADS